MILNVLVIGFVGLIAYWWANQGTFSAIIHCTCVIVAAALAFAVWEPLAIRILAMPGLEVWAWGIALLVPFAIFLLILRIAADKLVPDNLNFPQVVNYVVGGAFGLLAAIVTVGMIVLGAGFTQSDVRLIDFRGTVRTTTAKGQPDYAGSPNLWIPVHSITAELMATLSGGAFWPEFGKPIREVRPKLAAAAVSLHRDSMQDGLARTTAPPASVSVAGLRYSPDYENVDRSRGAYLLELSIGSGANDSGGILTVSSSQVMLVGKGSGAKEPPVAHPIQFSQPNQSGSRSLFAFDDVLNYCSNVPGQQESKMMFVFPATPFGPPEAGNGPRFVLFKNNRYELPAPTGQPLGGMEMLASLRGSTTGAGAGPLVDPTAKTIRSSDITNDAGIKPAVCSINELTTMEQVDQLLTEGVQEFVKGGALASKANRINGIFAREGTGIVRLDISRRNSSIDLWNDRTKTREEAGDSAPLYIVDSLGNQYTPIGYIWVKPDAVEIRLDPKRGIPTIGDFPNQPSSGAHELLAIFNPTAGAKIVSIRLGDKIVANADHTVSAAKD
jgi:hypothetical protein